MTSEQSQQATLRLLCLEGTAENSTLENPSENSLKLQDDSFLVVQTKSDLIATSPGNNQAVACSSVTGAGIENLLATIHERLKNALQHDGTAVASTSARCSESLHHANESLSRATQLVNQSGGEELIAAEVRDALMHLGRVVGAVYTDDVLDRIFSQFCIGK